MSDIVKIVCGNSAFCKSVFHFAFRFRYEKLRLREPELFGAAFQSDIVDSDIAKRFPGSFLARSTKHLILKKIACERSCGKACNHNKNDSGNQTGE